jgi:murein DD-endopeptidase MepM/ murein hydrolase activator NlpD
MTQSRIIFSAAMRRLTPPLLVWAVTAANLVHAQVGLGDQSPAVQYSTELRANETLNECLVRLKITDVDLYRAIEHIDIVDDIQALVVNTPIRLKVNPQGAVLSLKFPLSKASQETGDGTILVPTKFRVLVFSRDNKHDPSIQWTYVQEPTQIQTIQKSAHFDGNFFNVMDRQEIPDAVSEQFTRIFSGSVNFSNDLRHQASFSMTYEVAYLDNRPVATGKILHAQLDTASQQHHAYWWQTRSDPTGRYYSPAGEVLSARSWKSPILYARKTSNFGMRLDPFTLNWSNHQGIDIGAPTGTEVRATQQGKVKTIGYESHYGNVVVIEHGNGFETTYAHLSRFANISVHQSLKQGTLIGYVGSTGRSSGPHLHYELRRYGKALDPDYTFRGGDDPDPLGGTELEQFVQFQERLRTQSLTSKFPLLSKN